MSEDEISKMSEQAKERIAKIKEAALPLLKLLSEDYHPHHTAIVTSTSIELLEGVHNIPKIFEHIKD